MCSKGRGLWLKRKMYLSHPFRKTALIIPQHVLNSIHYQLSQSVHCSEIRPLIQYCTWLERQKVFSFFKYLAFCSLVIFSPRYTVWATIWLNANMKCHCLLQLWFFHNLFRNLQLCGQLCQTALVSAFQVCQNGFGVGATWVPSAEHSTKAAVVS